MFLVLRGVCLTGFGCRHIPLEEIHTCGMIEWFFTRRFKEMDRFGLAAREYTYAHSADIKQTPFEREQEQ